MKSKIIAFAILLIGSIGLFPSASAFGVGAHQSVGRTIFGGIDPNDCSIPVDVIGATPFRAQLNERVCRAIRGNRDAFLAGVIGPDTFPDLIVGQLTAHPGVVGGWQAADWLRHMLTNASSDEEVAFAYGYVVHGATDVLAHSYVNHYAGDFFDLARGGTSAEARHFALEKFIDVMLLRQERSIWGVMQGDRDPHVMPMSVQLEGVPPTEWLARVLILDPSASAQYERVPAAAHLIAMRKATLAIAGVGVEYRKLRASLLEQSYQIAADVLLAQTGLTGAKALLLGAENHANNMARAWELARVSLMQATEDVERLRAELNGIVKDLEETNNDIDRLEKEFSASAIALKAAEATLAWQTREWKKAAEAVERECKPERVCTERSRESLCWVGALVGFWQVCLISETVCNDVVRAICAVVRLTMESELAKLAAADAVYTAAKNLHDRIASQISAAKVRKLALDAARVTAEIQLGLAQLALDTAEKVAREHQRFYEEASVKLGEAQKELKAAEDRLGLAKAIEDAVAPVVERVDVIDIYLRDWETGSRRSVKEYIEASWEAARAVAAGEDGTRPYTRWLDCSYRLLLGVPGGALDLECKVRDEVKKFMEDLQKVVDSLPPELQWLINPLAELSQLLEAQLRVVLNEAVSAAADAVAGAPTGRFLRMLSGYAKVDEGRLTSTFDDPSADAQRILRLPNIVAMVYEDMGTTFSPLPFGKLVEGSAADTLAQKIADAMNAKNAKALPNFGVGPLSPIKSPPMPLQSKQGIWPEIGLVPVKKEPLFTQYVAIDQFKAYRNSRVLSALALLDPEELNRLVRHLAPDFKSVRYKEYATPLYDERVPRPFTLLYDSVRSLDGNHQWQTFGLPYPRRTTPAEPVNAQERRFGFGVHDHPEKGLRFFADPVARAVVFRRLFEGPIEGALLRHPAMRPTVYGFTACPANPFPAATTDDGEAATSDPGCSGWTSPTALPQVDSRTPNMSPKPIIKVIPKQKVPELQKFLDALEAAGKVGG